MPPRYYACDKPLASYEMADTEDGFAVHVGSECYRKIIKAGREGYQPPKGGPRLYPLTQYPRKE